MSLTGTPLSARFQLVDARLRNAAGAFVAPTGASIRAGVAAMLPSSTPNVLLPDPASPDRAAYPLTVVSYAAAATNRLTAEQAKDYALFLRYAARAGQVPGEEQGRLPEGYLPLDARQRRQLLELADAVASRKAPRARSTPSPTTTTDPGPPAPAAGGQTPAATPEPVGTATTAAPTPALIDLFRSRFSSQVEATTTEELLCRWSPAMRDLIGPEVESALARSRAP